MLKTLLGFFSVMFHKGVAYSTIKSAKCTLATILRIPPNPSEQKIPLVKYTIGIFNLRTQKKKNK